MAPTQDEQASERSMVSEVRALIPTSARTILDVGCGEGALGRTLKEERTVEVTGIEASAPAAAKARHFLDRVFTVSVEAVADKLQAAYYDCIVLAGSLESLPNPQKALALLKRCIKPEGTFVVSAANLRHWTSIKAILQNRWSDPAAGMSGPHLFTRKSLVDLLESAGLEIASVRPVRETGQPGMPEAIMKAIEAELGESSLAEESQDSRYLVVARPRVAAGVSSAAVPDSARVPQVAAQPPSPTAPKLPSPPPPAPVSKPGAGAPVPSQKPVASIIVLTWNQKDTTEKFLRSLEGSTKVPHEVIVVDNGSSDGTADFLKAYAAERATAKSDNVTVVSNRENAGVAKGFNQGLKAARGDYFILLHNDTLLPPQWLERLLRHFYIDKKAGMVGPRSCSAKPHQYTAAGYRDPGSDPAAYSAFTEALFNGNKGKQTQVESLGGFCLAVRREVLAKTGMLEESYEGAGYQDEDLCMRVRFAGFHLVVAEDVYVHHEGGAASRQNQVDAVQVAQANRGRFIDRWKLKPRIAYILRWTVQSPFTVAVLKQINDLVDREYEVRVITLDSQPGYFDLRTQVQHVGAFESLPPLDDDIVVVCSSLDLPIIAPKCRGKLVHLCQGYEPFLHGPTAEDAMADKPQIERYHSVPCARIVASEHLRGLFEERFCQKTFVVPNWLDEVLGAPKDTVWPGVLERPNILFAGRPTASRGFADFTAAIRTVREKHPGTTMHLAIPAHVIASQEKAEAMFGDSVVLHAGISRTEMEALYRSVDVAVCPAWYEGSGMTALEAMACGTPVVTADSMGIRDFCRDGENALVVPAAYPKKLAQAITRLIEDEALRKRLATEGPKTAARYTHEESANALQQAINTIFRWEVVPAGYKPSASDAANKVTRGLTSIIVPAFNQLEYTKKCLDSVLTYTGDPFELVVVDNGSTDGTWPYLEGLARKHKNVRVLRNPRNMGFAFACNQGIFLANGEFILLLNNDTLVTSGWLRRLRRIVATAPKAGLVGPLSNHVSGAQLVDSGDLRTMDHIQGYAGSLAVREAGQAIEVNRLSGFCLMVKREVFDRIGVLDPTFVVDGFEDDDLCIRARLAGFKCFVAQDVFVYHFGGRTFSGNNIDRKKQIDFNRRRFFTKWAALLQGASTGSASTAAESASNEASSAGSLTGAERLTRRMAERAASAESGSDDPEEHLPPDEMGGIALPPQVANEPPAASGRPDASSPESLDAQALALFQAGRFGKALALYEAVLSSQPDDRNARFNAALCYIQLGDTRKARRYLNPLTTDSGPEAASSAPSVFNLLGVSFMVEEDFRAAATCFEKALSIDPAHAEAQENLKVCREKAR